MKYLIFILVLFSSQAYAEDLTYIHDGVYVCMPVDTTQRDAEMAYAKYKFDKEMEYRISSNKEKAYITARMILDGRD